MSTNYVLARGGSTFSPRFQEKGVFSASFPIDLDAALATPYVAVSGDTIQLGWIAKGITIIDAFGFLAETGTSSSWSLGYTSANGNEIGGTAQTVNSATITKYPLFTSKWPLLIDSSVIADTTIPGRIGLYLKCTAVSAAASFTGHVTVVMCADYSDQKNPPVPISQPL